MCVLKLGGKVTDRVDLVVHEFELLPQLGSLSLLQSQLLSQGTHLLLVLLHHKLPLMVPFRTYLLSSDRIVPFYLINH